MTGDSLTAILRRKQARFISADIQAHLKLLLHALWYIPLFFSSALIVLAATVLLGIVGPIIKVRIRKIPADRIGPFANSVDLYLRRRALHERPRRELHLMLSDKPANRQLMIMAKRHIFVLENPFLLKLYKFARKYMKNSRIWDELPASVGSFREFNDAPPQLSFVEEEAAKGRSELLRMGIKAGDVLVCFQSRDKAYLDKIHPYHSREMWAYHDYRDSDISNYLPAAEYLASLGMFAIRVGYMVERSIKTANPRIIDYSTNYRSDFMDIYLLANCKFFLGNNGGLVCVAQAFGIPVAAANWIPIKVRLVSKRDIFIPKKLWSIEKKRSLTFREIITSGMDIWGRSEEYAGAGIEAVENTADDILALAKEMNERLDNRWVVTQEDEELQRRYKDLFPPHYYSSEVPSRIGAEFLRQNRELLE